MLFASKAFFRSQVCPILWDHISIKPFRFLYHAACPIAGCSQPGKKQKKNTTPSLLHGIHPATHGTVQAATYHARLLYPIQPAFWFLLLQVFFDLVSSDDLNVIDSTLPRNVQVIFFSFLVCSVLNSRYLSCERCIHCICGTCDLYRKSTNFLVKNLKAQ